MSCTQVAIRVIGPQVQLVALFEFATENWIEEIDREREIGML